jgi:hypothetical protein
MDELREALRELTPAALRELAAHSQGASTLGEIAARLDAEAVRSERAAEGFVARSWYRESEAERERAEGLRRRAKALRVLEAAAS